jgi:hypothetical protein
MVKNAVILMKMGNRNSALQWRTDSSAQMTVRIWKTVVILLVNLGFTVGLWFVMIRTQKPRAISISRLKTITVSQLGMMRRIARVTKAEARRSLSAMGSR